MTESLASDQLARQSLRVSKILCFVTMFLTLLTAVGWIIGVRRLTQWQPTLPAMQPNTAVGLFLSAVAILRTGERATKHRRALLALLPASAVLLLGVLTLGEYAFGWNVGVDRIFIHSVPTLDEPFPGRPTPQTALNLTLLGASIVWFNLGIRPRPLAQIGAMAAAVNALVAGTAYIFGAEIFYGFPLHKPALGMGVHTASAFVLCVVAFFCAQPRTGMMTLLTTGTQAGAMAGRILLAGIFVPPAVGALARLGVEAGWYEEGAEISLFALAMIGLILQTTWQAARKAEQEELRVRAAREELEAARLSLEDANQELTRANVKTKELAQLKTRVFSAISHELRTPLTLIIGPIEKHLGSNAGLGTELRQDLEVAERNARTVLRHVNDLLDSARLQAGGLKPDYVEEDAAALVRSVADHFSALAKEKHIAFAVEAPAALPVQVDSDKFQRILLNLLSNAFKFTPAGGRVRISLGQTNDRIQMEVADSGSGIPAEHRSEVFEPFHQLETGSTRRSSGTGLGLSIVREFAGLLAGTISVADAPEGGALFVLDLPSVAPPGTTVGARVGERTDTRDIKSMIEGLRDKRPAPTPGAIAPGLNGRVLVVEDNRDLSAFITQSLVTRGFSVAAAFDGREGYEQVIAQRPDLVLTDIMMPVMGGDELVRSLRQRSDLSSTPIVVLTAKADAGLRVRLLTEGAQDYLEKPFSVEELCARAQNLVARKRAEDRNVQLRQQVEGVARWLQAVIDQMPEGIELMDGDGHVTLLNRSMTSLAAGLSPERDRFGNPVAVDLRRPSGERVSPDDLPIIKAIVDKTTTQASEFVARRADGRLTPVLVSAAPIQDEQGQLVGATMVFQDVSTLKELEHLREEWASIVAHDLQQPIGVIVLRSDLLLRDGLTPSQREHVGEVREAAKRLSRMASDLMDASQLEAKRLQVHLNHIDLSQLLHSVTRRVPGAVPRVEIRTPPNSRLFVRGDEQRLEQVVTNLLSNALKYSTPDTAIRVDVGEDQRNAQVQVSVTNRGPGISEHELPSLFARFVRSRAARTSTTTGSGLGLYIAKGLIEAHGGRIWAESIPGENTTFHFTLPINGPPVRTIASVDRGAARREGEDTHP